MQHTFRHRRNQQGSAITPFRMVLIACIVALVATVVTGCKRDRRGSDEVRSDNLQIDLAKMNEARAVLDKPLTLEMAVAFALRNNTDAAVAELEQSISLESSTGARLKMLPSLSLGKEDSLRNSYDASVSKTMIAGTTGTDPSYSEEKRKSTFNVNLAWSVLDFGISYFRWQQSQKQAGVAARRVERTRQNLALQVTESYWQAQVTRESYMASKAVLDDMDERMAKIKKQLEEGSINRTEALEEEARLLESQVRFRRYEKDYRSAVAKVASLLGLSAGAKIELAKETFGNLNPEELPAVDELELVALKARPELFEFDLQEKVASDEARIALVSMFPNAQLFARKDHDGNKYLYSHDWYSAGINATMNLLSIPQHLSKRRTAKMQGELARRKRLAITIGIIAQVRLADIEYKDAVEEFGIVKGLWERRSEILREYAKGEKEGTVRGDKVQEAERHEYTSRVKMLESYSRVMVARARLLNTCGKPPIVASVTDEKKKTDGESGSVPPGLFDSSKKMSFFRRGAERVDGEAVGKQTVKSENLPDEADEIETGGVDNKIGSADPVVETDNEMVGNLSGDKGEDKLSCTDTENDSQPLRLREVEDDKASDIAKQQPVLGVRERVLIVRSRPVVKSIKRQSYVKGLHEVQAKEETESEFNKAGEPAPRSSGCVRALPALKKARREIVLRKLSEPAVGVPAIKAEPFLKKLKVGGSNGSGNPAVPAPVSPPGIYNEKFRGAQPNEPVPGPLKAEQLPKLMSALDRQ